jgi:hypothetical protein
MHLGLTDGPFVSHNLISTQESPVPLLKFQMAPRLKILMPSGPRKEPDILFLFSHKSRQTNSIQVPQQGPYGERYPFTGHFYICLETCTKIPLNKNFFLSKALRKERPSMFPKSRTPMGADAHFQSVT